MWRRVVLGLAAVLAAASLLGTHAVTIDEHVYRVTLAGMRHGRGYYEAMRDALVPVYGAPSAVRAFRLPTWFLVWRWVPCGLFGLRLLFLAVAAVGSVLAARAARASAVAAALVFVSLVVMAGLLPGAVEQLLLVEVWTVPLVAAAWWAYRSDRPWLAAGFAVAAAASREMAVLVVVGGLMASLVERRRVMPWFAAVAAVAAVWLAHAHLAGGWVAAGGHESPLIGYGYNVVERFGRMAGFGFPATVVTGPLLFAGGVWAAWRRREWFLAPLLFLPCAAVVADRPYWGALAVPFYVVLIAASGRVDDDEVDAVAKLAELLAHLAHHRPGAGNDDRRVDDHEVEPVAGVGHQYAPVATSHRPRTSIIAARDVWRRR